MVGAAVSMFEVTTLGQPLEVLKTHMAAHRESGLKGAIRDVWYRGASGGGGIRGFYQGTFITHIPCDPIVTMFLHFPHKIANGLMSALWD
jgi:hypothetical protein